MNSGSIYAVTAIVCTLQILLIYNRSRATEYKETIDRPFCSMLIFFSVFSTVDSIWGMFDAALFGLSRAGFLLATYGYHIMAALSAFVSLGYAMTYVKAGEKERRIVGGIRGGLLAVQLLLLLWNGFSHNVFWLDEEGIYRTGKLRILLYAIQMLYYLILMAYTGYQWQRKKKRAKLYRNAFLFAFIPWIFCLGQYAFYDVAMYSLGFTFAAFMIYTYNVTAQREHFMEELMSSHDRMQSAIIQGLAGNFVAIYYVDLETEEFDIYRKSEKTGKLVKDRTRNTEYFSKALENGKKYVIPEDLGSFTNKFSKEAILAKLQDKNSYAITVRILNRGDIQYFQYRFVQPIPEEESGKLIVGVYNVDEEIRSEIARQEENRQAYEREVVLRERAAQLSMDVYMDAMTGLYNRRAYEDDVRAFEEGGVQDNFVYFSIDLNGLKIVNDSMGHEAGDELLTGASFCMSSCLGVYGKLYRIGGDEFVAMISAEKDKLYEIITDFDSTVASWKGKTVKELTVSYGFVTRSEHPEMSVREIAKLADKRMYQDKEDFYANRGIDRRGQQEAYSAVCSSYTKILKVNLTMDRFIVIQMDQSEKDKTKGYHETISMWLSGFAKSGQVHEEDRENYLEKTEIDYLRNYFRSGNKALSVYYRRMIGTQFKRAMMEMIPASEYTDEEQIIFLYVKNIEG